MDHYVGKGAPSIVVSKPFLLFESLSVLHTAGLVSQLSLVNNYVKNNSFLFLYRKKTFFP